MRQEPYIDVDVHGMTVDQAIEKINSLIKRANSSTYRIRIVHGLNPKVLRIVGGDNPGVTELVLREY